MHILDADNIFNILLSDYQKNIFSSQESQKGQEEDSDACTIYQELPSDSVTQTVSVQINHNPEQNDKGKATMIKLLIATNSIKTLCQISTSPVRRENLLMTPQKCSSRERWRVQSFPREPAAAQSERFRQVFMVSFTILDGEM